MVSILALSVKACRLCQIPPFVAARHLPPARGKSFLKGRALGSPRKVHLFAKASPFGRGVTVGDGEGEPARAKLQHKFDDFLKLKGKINE